MEPHIYNHVHPCAQATVPVSLPQWDGTVAWFIQNYAGESYNEGMYGCECCNLNLGVQQGMMTKSLTKSLLVMTEFITQLWPRDYYSSLWSFCFSGLYPLNQLVRQFVHTPVTSLVGLVNAQGVAMEGWFGLSGDIQLLK